MAVLLPALVSELNGQPVTGAGDDDVFEEHGQLSA
jgi:hypothetical protein